MPTWLIQIIVLLIIQLIIYMLTPKPKTPKPAAAQTMESPTTDAGRPIPKIWGTKLVEDPNCWWYGEKSIVQQKIKA